METNSAVKTRRLQLGLTQAKVVNTAGVSLSTYQRYETGDYREGQPLTEHRIATALRWPTDAFDTLRAGNVPAEVVEPVAEPDGGDAVGALQAELAALRADVAELTYLHGELLLRVGRVERASGASTR